MTTPANPDTTYAPDPAFAKAAHVDAAGYAKMYAASMADPDAFWGEQGKRLDWIKPYETVKDTSFEPGNVSVKWYPDGTLNVSANCIARLARLPPMSVEPSISETVPSGFTFALTADFIPALNQNPEATPRPRFPLGE